MAHPTRIFHNELEISKAFEEYKESLKEEAKNWGKVQYVGKDGKQVIDYPNMPLTLEGFYIYCRKHYGEVKQYFLNQDNLYNDFITICCAIKEEIRQNQITGGLLGFYNPSITQRLNNLTDTQKTDITTNGKDLEYTVTLNLK
jgi:hypothetical protein